MGIKDFFKALKRYGYKREYIIFKKDFKNKVITIDGDILFRPAKSWSFEYRKKNKYIFLIYFIRMIMRFIKNNSFPIFVFDGQTGQLKNDENKKRKKERKKYIDKLQIYEKRKEIFKKRRMKTFILFPKIFTKKIKHRICLFSKSYHENYKKYQANKSIWNSLYKQHIWVHPTPDEKKLLIQILKNLNIPVYVIDNYEAETFCGFLNRNKIADYIISQDTDCILSGKNHVKKYNNTHSKFEIVRKNNVLKILNFNEEELFNYCMLLGSDFTKRIKGWGIVKNYNTIKKCKDNGTKIVYNKYGMEIIKEIKGYITHEFHINNELREIKEIKEKNFDLLIKKIKINVELKKINFLLNGHKFLNNINNFYRKFQE
jgi:5'-3' exonuclease